MNKIILSDALIVLERLNNNSVDAIVTDLPYYNVVKDSWDNQWKSKKEYLDWVKLHIIEFNRILKPGGNCIIFTSRQYNRNISSMLDEYFMEKRIIIWKRKRGFNNTRGKSLASGYEPICYYTKGNTGTFNNIKIFPNTDRKEYVSGILRNGITLSDVWDDIPALPHNSKEKTELPYKHSTQKPLKLMERIILLFSNAGDVILDPFAGSGTTGEACILHNRKFIMIDNDLECIKNMQHRLKMPNISD